MYFSIFYLLTIKTIRFKDTEMQMIARNFQQEDDLN